MQECKQEELPNFTVTGEGLITAKQCRHWQMCEQKQRQQMDFVVSGRDAALPPRPFPSGARGPTQSLGSLRKENLFCPSTETQTQGLSQILIPTWLYWARGSPAAAHGCNSQPPTWVVCPKPKICARHSPMAAPVLPSSGHQEEEKSPWQLRTAVTATPPSTFGAEPCTADQAHRKRLRTWSEEGW